jgi:hypothetical protein
VFVLRESVCTRRLAEVTIRRCAGKHQWGKDSGTQKLQLRFDPRRQAHQLGKSHRKLILKKEGLMNILTLVSIIAVATGVTLHIFKKTIRFAILFLGNVLVMVNSVHAY